MLLVKLQVEDSFAKFYKFRKVSVMVLILSKAWRKPTKISRIVDKNFWGSYFSTNNLHVSMKNISSSTFGVVCPTTFGNYFKIIFVEKISLGKQRSRDDMSLEFSSEVHVDNTW